MVSSKDILESMDFSKIQRKFYKKIVFFNLFEGVSYVLAQVVELYDVATLHLAEFLTPDPQPFPSTVQILEFLHQFFWRRLPLPFAQG